MSGSGIGLPDDESPDVRFLDENPSGSRENYDPLQVVVEYSANISETLEEVGSEFEAGGYVELKWQTDTIRGMLRVVPNEPERLPALVTEFQDFMNEVSSRADDSGSKDDQSVSSNTSIEADREEHFFSSILGKLLTKRVPSDFLKMIMHLRTPTEWTLSFELSANMVVFGGKGGISVKFGK